MDNNQKFVESMLDSAKKKNEKMVTDKRRELTDDEVKTVDQYMETLKKGGVIRKK